MPVYFLSRIYLYENKLNVPIQNQFILILMIFHYFNRTFIYSLSIKGGKPTGLMPFCMAFIFTSINGLFQSLCLLQFKEYFIINDKIELNVIIGVLLFFIGFLINKQSDDILRNLRKNKNDKSYKIPYGGLFYYITNPHYFGETIEWLGFGIAGNNIGGYCFAFFTFANLFPRGCHNHTWYQNKFKEDYPKLNRKIFIPFIL